MLLNCQSLIILNLSLFLNLNPKPKLTSVNPQLPRRLIVVPLAPAKLANANEMGENI